MKKLWFKAMMGAAVLLCAGCVMTAGPHGASVAIAPALPVVVELETPFIVHGGFHYFYDDGRWFYARQKNGPWIDLPRDRYPKEIRHKGKGHYKDKRWKRGHH